MRIAMASDHAGLEQLALAGQVALGQAGIGLGLGGVGLGSAELRRGQLRQRHAGAHRLADVGQDAFDAAGEGVLITDAEQNIIAVNKAFSRVTGYAEDEVLGKMSAAAQSTGRATRP